MNDNDWAYMKSLKNGEIVEPIMEVPEDNAFCCTCGFSWPAQINMEMVSIDAIKRERRERGTAVLLQEEYKKQQDIEKQKDARHGKIVNSFRKFIGKL